MQNGLNVRVTQKAWENAARISANLSQLKLSLGQIHGTEPDSAIQEAEQSVTYAERANDASMLVVNKTTLADALHQAGRQTEAKEFFKQAEIQQAARQPDYPLLYSVSGFRHCDLLLAELACAAWRAQLNKDVLPPQTEVPSEIEQRATKTLKWVVAQNWLLDMALNHLTIGLARLYAAILQQTAISVGSLDFGAYERIDSEIQQAVDGLRRYNSQFHLPRALMARAWLRCTQGQFAGPESAQTDLDEAWEIAKRGPMPLFVADIHLHRARLFMDTNHYPWCKNTDGTARSQQDDLTEARRLIEKHGYWRRKEELEDAEAALKKWTTAISTPKSKTTEQMKIPTTVVYVVGDVLGNWYFSHTKLNTLFGRNGFPGEIPPGNCVTKSQEWLRRANSTDGVDPLGLLGSVLVEFINLDYQDNQQWLDGCQKITDVLAKNGYALDLNGNITPILATATTHKVSSQEPAESAHASSSIDAAISQPATKTTLPIPTIVVVTVNDHETDALLDAFLGVGHSPTPTSKAGVTYNELGIHGGHRLIHTICEMRNVSMTLQHPAS